MPERRRGGFAGRSALVAGCLLLCLAALHATASEVVLLPQEPYPVPAILQLPPGPGPHPAVLLLHGTASHKDEVGNLYRRLADALAVRGVASLRIDFAGTGDSPVSYREYTLTSAVRDARTALRHLHSLPDVDSDAIAVMGFSQGGLIAQRVALAEPTVRALATWSSMATDGVGSFAGFFDDYYEEARRAGFAEVSFGWRAPLPFALQWFEELRTQRTLSEMRDWSGPILAVAGLADTTVPWQQSVDLVTASENPTSTSALIAGADHTFNVLDPDDQQSAREVLRITADWLAARLR